MIDRFFEQMMYGLFAACFLAVVIAVIGGLIFATGTVLAVLAITVGFYGLIWLAGYFIERQLR